MEKPNDQLVERNQEKQVLPEDSLSINVADVTDKPETAQSPPESKVGNTSFSQSDQAVETSDRRAQALNLLEAALFVAGRPLDINEMCQAVGSRSKKRVTGYAETLIEQYKARSGPIEILALKGDRYVLQVKAEFTPLIKKLVNRPLLSSGPLKTLSYIAYRQPITQKRVIEVRGQHAYGHVKLLKDMGLIITERSGRSFALKTTDYFADYFGLATETLSLKRDLRKIFGDAIRESIVDRERKKAEEEEEKQAVAEMAESEKMIESKDANAEKSL